MRAYIKAKGADISEENAEGGLHVDLAQIIEACDVCLRDDDKGRSWSTAYNNQRWQILSCMCSNIVEIRSEVTLLFLDAALEILMSCCPSCRCGECDEQYCVSAVDPGDREAGGSHWKSLWETGEVQGRREALPPDAAVRLQEFYFVPMNRFTAMFNNAATAALLIHSFWWILKLAFLKQSSWHWWKLNFQSSI